MPTTEIYTVESVWSAGALSRLDAAEFIGVRETKFRQLVAAHGWPVRYVGDKPVYPKAVLIAFLGGLPSEPPKPKRKPPARAKTHTRRA